MKKLIILLTAIYIAGCEEIPEGTFEPSNIEYQVASVNAITNASYPHDSSFVTSVKINNSSNISEIWLNFYSPDDEQINTSPFYLKDNGDRNIGDLTANDGVFSAKLSMSNSDINGIYRIDYYALDKQGKTTLLVKHHFNYDNGQVKYPPVLYDLDMPDTVSAGVNNEFIFTIKAKDENGLRDIKNVFFKFIRIEVDSSSSYFAMNDDGNANFGDSYANDGIYSYKSYFLEEVKGKTRQFIFQAIDRSDSLSNIITHNIYVK